MFFGRILDFNTKNLSANSLGERYVHDIAKHGLVKLVVQPTVRVHPSDFIFFFAADLSKVLKWEWKILFTKAGKEIKNFQMMLWFCVSMLNFICFRV